MMQKQGRELGMTQITDRNNVIRDIKGFMFDLDGVLWLGDHPIPGVANTLKQLRREGKQLMFVSNTSSRSKAKCLSIFKHMGLDVDSSEVFIASECAAKYVASQMPGAVTYVLGSEGLLEEALAAGLDARNASTRNPEKAHYLIAGKDNDLSFSRLTCALRVLQSGARFVAVNCDPTVPSQDGLEPGAGAIVAAITAMVNRDPDVIVGKPGTLLLEMALEQSGLDAAECAIVGDTLETDILAGNRLGLSTILVLSGNSKGLDMSAPDAYPIEFRPDIVMNSVEDLVY